MHNFSNRLASPQKKTASIRTSSESTTATEVYQFQDNRPETRIQQKLIASITNLNIGQSPNSNIGTSVEQKPNSTNAAGSSVVQRMLTDEIIAKWKKKIKKLFKSKKYLAISLTLKDINKGISFI